MQLGVAHPCVMAASTLVVPPATKVQFQPIPVPQLCGNVENSFAYFTIKDRLPVTLQKAVEDVQLTLSMPEVQQIQSASNVGTAISNGIQVLSMELAANAPLFPFPQSMSHGDTLWNPLLQDCTWFDGPWLTAECYMYRRLQRLFENAGVTGAGAAAASPGAEYWKSYDVFQRRKQDSFWVSIEGMKTAAAALQDMLAALPAEPAPYPAPGPFGTEAQQQDAVHSSKAAQMKMQFQQVLQNSLWGNQADLSLHTAFDGKRVRQLQPQNGSNGAAAEQGEVPDILVDEFEAIWQDTVQFMRGARTDIVLDNAGFELFMDLCLADWLVSSGHAGVCMLHCKQMPWFVSDTTRSDVQWMLEAMRTAGEQHGCAALQQLSSRWQGHLADGRWQVRCHAFWTCALPFWEMPWAAADLYGEICRNSSLVFWKGDLNYRRLVGDGEWEYTTPITTAVGALAQPQGQLLWPPSVILRTCKSDTIAGLAPGVSDKVSAWEIEVGRAKYGYEWMTEGRYGMVQYLNSR